MSLWNLDSFQLITVHATLHWTSHLAGQDYQAVTNMRLGPFGNSDRRQCFDVNITNDAEPEDPEDFMVIVQFCPGEAQPERVDIDPQTATTTIMDDDSELHVIADCNIK